MSARKRDCGLSGVSVTILTSLCIAAVLAGVSASSHAAAIIPQTPAPDDGTVRAPKGLDLKAAAAAVLGKQGGIQDEGKQMESMLHWCVPLRAPMKSWPSTCDKIWLLI